jgi:hypothetical protein
MTFRGGIGPAAMAVGQRERTLSPYPAADVIGLKHINSRRAAFTLGFVAIILTFALPGSLLNAIGLYSYQPGGNPLTKFHPATYVAVLAALVALYGRRQGGGLAGLFRESPALAWSVVLIFFCMAYSTVSLGIGGVAVYVDTFLSAALVTIALDAGTQRQRQILGYTIVAFCVINVGLSVYEDHTQTLLLPSGVAADETGLPGKMALDEFRGQGFYGHPLSGALVTSMALFMVLGMGLRGWRLVALFGIFVVGLMSFGGRGALATSLLILGAAALFQLTSGLATGRLNVGFLGAFIAGVFLLPALLVLLTTMTDIGLRVTSHLYLDDSADVRIVQWRVLSLLNVHDLLFGAAGDRIGLLKAQIGLTGVGIDIENPWLLTFLALGVLGFPFLMAALFLFLWHLGRRVDTPIGWLIVIATLLICSTNNSLGRKVPDLMFLSGIMIALSGFKKSEERESVAMAPVVSGPPDRTTAIALAPGERNRSLADQPYVRRVPSTLSG